MDSLIIGIAGGTGSGKTTITKKIVEHFPNEVSVVYHDNYYKAHNEMTYEERSHLNYDHPDAFETTLMIDHLKKLKSGRAIACPVYDYTVHNRFADKTETVFPNKVIIVEGILIFAEKELSDLFDIRIFVDTDADVRILRRLLRDVKSRGRSMESVIEQYLTTVKPMHDLFVEPSKRRADIIVPEGGENQVALDMILKKIETYVK